MPAQSASVRAGAYLSSWSTWAAEKRKQGWRKAENPDVASPTTGEFPEPATPTISELAEKNVDEDIKEDVKKGFKEDVDDDVDASTVATYNAAVLQDEQAEIFAKEKDMWAEAKPDA